MKKFLMKKNYRINDLVNLTKEEYIEFTQIVEKNFKNGDLLCCRGKGLMPRLICKLTRSKYSHVGMVFTLNNFIYCLEITWNKIKISKISEMVESLNTHVDYFEILGASESQRSNTVDFCFQQIGNRYKDWWILKFIYYLFFNKNNKWFCSYLFNFSYQLYEFELLENNQHYVSPEDISTSRKMMKKISFSNTGTIL